MSPRNRPRGGARPIRFVASVASGAGDLSVSYELTDTLRMRAVAFSGELAAALGPRARAALERGLEGAHLDQEVLVPVLRRAFQENEVALAGVAPEDLARALLAAREAGDDR